MWTILVLLLAGWLPGPARADEVSSDWILDELQQKRLAAGAHELKRREDLDGIALQRARTLAELPHEERLKFEQTIESALREGGVSWFKRASMHVDMVRGYRRPAAALLRSWEDYDRAWSKVLRREQDAIGLAIYRAEDGWVILVGVLLEEFPFPKDLARLERETIARVNEVRREHGLFELKENEALASVARTHSEDMASRDYLGHESPEGDQAADRVTAGGIEFRSLAENIQVNRGMDDPVRAAVKWWMSSPGHREAILTPEFRETGVGVVLRDDGSFYFTQLFINPRFGPGL
jgi:uncharacterized protein YkwD